MTTLRLLADDLTGALDTTAELVPLTGPVPVFWPSVLPAAPTGDAAIDSATRECQPWQAEQIVRRLCPLMREAAIAFKKIDSLMRGPTFAEIAGCVRSGIWRRAVLAPAFPFQGRVTRQGRQWARSAAGWTPVSEDLCAALQALGIAASRAVAGEDLHPGVTVVDAETDADLLRVAASGSRFSEPVLWIGTGGLAQALAAGNAHPAPSPLPQPILGLFGSDHAVTRDQLAACGEHWLDVEAGTDGAVAERLDTASLALVSFRLDAGLARDAASRRIADGIGALVQRIDPPGTVVAAGGETLRSLCEAVDAAGLRVEGRLLPGVPRSVIQGGRWNGATVVSKSGAFGPPDLLRRLLLDERNAA